MGKATDIQVIGTALHLLEVRTRVPLKFGPETLTCVTCARARVRVADAGGRTALGWGETPLSVQWVWPSQLSHQERRAALVDFTTALARAWAAFGATGHPMELGHDFQQQCLEGMWRQFNAARAGREPLPWLAALVCCSAFDLAVHDAFGVLHQRPTYQLYGPAYLNRHLAAFLSPAADSAVSFSGRYPADFLQPPAVELPVWHLVGGKDLLEPADLSGADPADGYPVLLRDWILRDGLKCLKIKLRGDDCQWDYERIVQIGKIAAAEEVDWLSADFNCTVHAPAYVTEWLDRLLREDPRTYGRILYVEQPFPHDLENNPIDVHAVAARKPLFMDESAHDWRLVALGRRLGWTGVALKTCKTQTGALLSLCWAKAHGMTLMVQDLTNPMLAQISHCLLAAHAGTIMGVESNSMQFYPGASQPEARVHPGLYVRRHGRLDLRTVQGPGFGYRLAEIKRELPDPVVVCDS